MIAIDYGTKKSGLAYSVEGFCFAYKTVPTKELLAVLAQLIPMRQTDTLILGMPYNIDGTISAHAKRVLAFANVLRQEFPDVEVILHDERLTTSEALLSDIDDIDAESARLILTDYLSR